MRITPKRTRTIQRRKLSKRKIPPTLKPTTEPNASGLGGGNLDANSLGASDSDGSSSNRSSSDDNDWDIPYSGPWDWNQESSDTQYFTASNSSLEDWSQDLEHQYFNTEARIVQSSNAIDSYATGGPHATDKAPSGWDTDNSDEDESIILLI